jgi:hypothetical protein
MHIHFHRLGATFLTNYRRSNKMNKLLTCALVLCAITINQVSADIIVGSSSGIFVNPVGAVYSGEGTSHFQWGEGDPSSSLDFTGASFSTNTEKVFSFGTLNFYNGVIVSGTDATAVSLAIELSLTTPAKDETFTYNLTLNNTPNNGDPLGDADYVQFPSAYPTTTFSIGGVDYTLQLMGFGTVTSAGYTTINEFHVLEQQGASAVLLGKITANIPNNNVPEPGIISMILFGILTVGGVSFSRKK